MPKTRHLLCSVQLNNGHTFHTYVMTNDEHFASRLPDHALNIIDQQGLTPLLNIALLTNLSTGANIVHQCLKECAPQAWKTFQTATDFHISAFTLNDDAPWNQKLMDLH